MEEWKDILETNGFQISNIGRVKKGNLIYTTYHLNKYGRGIYLPVNSKAVLFYIHELVEKYFGTLDNVHSTIISDIRSSKPKKCCNKR